VYENCGDESGFNDWGDNGEEELNDVWRWACDEEMKEVECHVIVMDHVVHYIVNDLDGVSKKD